MWRWGVGCGVSGVGCRVSGVGCRVSGAGEQRGKGQEPGVRETLRADVPPAPMPNSQCPIPNAQFPMPNSQLLKCNFCDLAEFNPNLLGGAIAQIHSYFINARF